MTKPERTLYLIRHAKSSWADLRLSDHDRPLNDRGKRDLPRMAEFVLAKHGLPDLIISSTAKRARHTARGFKNAHPSTCSLILNEDLYLSSPEEAIIQLRSLGQGNSVALVGHNPGWTDFMNRVESVAIDNMPTCAVGIFKCSIFQWSDLQWSDLRFVDFIYPKGLM